MAKPIDELEEEEDIVEKYIGKIHWLLNNSELAYTCGDITDELGNPADLENNSYKLTEIIGRLESERHEPYNISKLEEKDGSTYYFSERNI